MQNLLDTIDLINSLCKYRAEQFVKWRITFSEKLETSRSEVGNKILRNTNKMYF